MSDINGGMSCSCLVLGVVIAIVLLAIITLIVIALVPSKVKQGAGAKSLKAPGIYDKIKEKINSLIGGAKKQGGSAIYFPGDNVAEPLESYNNEKNKEYDTLVEMNKRRVEAEIRKKRGETASFEVLARTLNLDTTPVSKEDVEKVSHGEEAPSSLTPAQKTALGMYLGVGAKIEEQNDAFTPIAVEMYK